jgi:hypothetical protein
MALPLVPDHAFGSCTGTSKFNGHVIAFLPTDGFEGGFNQALSELEKCEFNDKLGLHFKGRFGLGRLEGKEEGRGKMKKVHESLMKLIKNQG